MQPSDEELYRLMKNGNQDAFAQLYERREPALHRFALHMSGSPAIAEEVSHEVFVQLMGPSARFDETRGTLESFLYGIARNLVRVVRRQGPVAEPVETVIRSGHPRRINRQRDDRGAPSHAAGTTGTLQGRDRPVRPGGAELRRCGPHSWTAGRDGSLAASSSEGTPGR